VTLPVASKVWTFSLNNRITYVSLNDLSASYLFGIKTFLVANGYTLKGSCNGAVGAMDGVDRWLTKANCTTRGATAATAQSWCALTDKSGFDILLTYLGATDDVWSYQASPSGVMVAAGTPAQQPTATDAITLLSGITVVGTATTGDRIWNGWVDSTSKLCRFVIMRAGLAISMFGAELMVPAVVAPCVLPVPTAGWALALSASSLVVGNYWQAPPANRLAATRVTVSGTPVLVTLGSTGEFGSIGPTVWQYTAPVTAEAQGSTGPIILPMGWNTATAGARGKIGNQIDRYYSYDVQADGTLTVDKKWIFWTGSATVVQGGVLFPWDGATAPVLS